MAAAATTARGLSSSAAVLAAAQGPQDGGRAVCRCGTTTGTDAFLAYEGAGRPGALRNYDLGCVVRQSSGSTRGISRAHPRLEVTRGSSRRSQSMLVRAVAGDGGGVAGGLRPELKEAIDQYVASNKVVLFMKGSKLFPQCGFSNTCVQILNVLNVPYETVNILEDEDLRQGMKEYSKWPTFPQLYVDKEFIGGCDIMIELYQNGELQEIVEKALVS
ncbi:hypothetical protein CBR_g41800 [Chara braunii]|uniref:Glutaredoxin domain-containing protein n=1 Tax=Chara braunii TaxID=69332 RepID=A0A388LWT6_CHABU|nr:hypothetical protein CBR_g41800 [Chara braunii]|eukprot:GBG86735.1 hypothetical protein CBR_g41800 [Chara braunii]